MPVRSELEPIAIVGYSITLPKDVVTGQRFFELIRQKTQLTEAIDVVEAGRYDMSLVDENDTKNPWKLRGRHSTFFTEEESESLMRPSSTSPLRCLRPFSRSKQPFYNPYGRPSRMQAFPPLRYIAPTQASSVRLTPTLVGILMFARHGFHNHTNPQTHCISPPPGAAAEAPDETFMRSQLMSSVSDGVAYFLGTTGANINDHVFDVKSFCQPKAHASHRCLGSVLACMCLCVNRPLYDFRDCLFQ